MKMIRNLMGSLLMLAMLAVPVSAAVYRPGSPVTTTNRTPVNDADMGAVTVAPKAATGVLFSVDTDTYGGVAVQLTGTWAATVTFQGSNDNVTWATLSSIGAVDGAAATTSTANGNFYLPARTRYVRANVTAYTSGTVGATAYLRHRDN